jgi:hypothetical protein
MDDLKERKKLMLQAPHYRITSSMTADLLQHLQHTYMPTGGPITAKF